MSGGRADANYGELHNRIRDALRKAMKTLAEQRYKSQQVSPREFFDYLTGETLTGDKITIHDILSNEYLVLHEAVEISELKKMKVPIGKHTIVEYSLKVYEAHFKATESEFNYALGRKDLCWLGTRLKHAKDWPDDPYLPKELVKRCKSVIAEFSKYLPVKSEAVKHGQGCSEYGGFVSCLRAES